MPGPLAASRPHAPEIACPPDWSRLVCGANYGCTLSLTEIAVVQWIRGTVYLHVVQVRWFPWWWR